MTTHIKCVSLTCFLRAVEPFFQINFIFYIILKSSCCFFSSYFSDFTCLLPVVAIFYVHKHTSLIIVAKRILLCVSVRTCKILSLCNMYYLFCLPSLLPALCVMIAASIYTAQNKSFHVTSLHQGSYGSSYILAWVSFPMTFFSGLMYLVLRKRK